MKTRTSVVADRIARYRDTVVARQNKTMARERARLRQQEAAAGVDGAQSTSYTPFGNTAQKYVLPRATIPFRDATRDIYGVHKPEEYWDQRGRRSGELDLVRDALMTALYPQPGATADSTRRVLVLTGPSGCGKDALLRTACPEAEVYEWPPGASLTTKRGVEELRKKLQGKQNRAQYDPRIVVIYADSLCIPVAEGAERGSVLAMLKDIARYPHVPLVVMAEDAKGPVYQLYTGVATHAEERHNAVVRENGRGMLITLKELSDDIVKFIIARTIRRLLPPSLGSVPPKHKTGWWRRSIATCQGNGHVACRVGRDFAMYGYGKARGAGGMFQQNRTHNLFDACRHVLNGTCGGTLVAARENAAHHCSTPFSLRDPFVSMVHANLYTGYDAGRGVEGGSMGSSRSRGSKGSSRSRSGMGKRTRGGSRGSSASLRDEQDDLAIMQSVSALADLASDSDMMLDWARARHGGPAAEAGKLSWTWGVSVLRRGHSLSMPVQNQYTRYVRPRKVDTYGDMVHYKHTDKERDRLVRRYEQSPLYETLHHMASLEVSGKPQVKPTHALCPPSLSHRLSCTALDLLLILVARVRKHKEMWKDTKRCVDGRRVPATPESKTMTKAVGKRWFAWCTAARIRPCDMQRVFDVQMYWMLMMFYRS